MRFVRAQTPIPSDATRYLRRRATSDREGPAAGVFDRYRTRVRARAGEEAEQTFERVLGQLMAYDIFPPRLVRLRLHPGPAIAEGTTIVQRVGIGVAIEAAVRVVDVWDRSHAEKSAPDHRDFPAREMEPDDAGVNSPVRRPDGFRHDAEDRSAGFAYVTLEGHPERGVATFEVQLRGDEVWVELTARSVAGTLVTRIGRPVARLVQKGITKRALRRLSES